MKIKTLYTFKPFNEPKDQIDTHYWWVSTSNLKVLPEFHTVMVITMDLTSF